jgi:hypothetical protein
VRRAAPVSRPWAWAQVYAAKKLGEADFTVPSLEGLTAAQLQRRFAEVSRS